MSNEKSDLVNNEIHGKQDNLHNLFSIRKNFVLISLAFVFLFTAYNGVINLQSSIINEKNVGFNALTINAGFSILSCLFLTNPLVFLTGYKWTMFISEIIFLVFVASNIYPKAWLLYPASALCGVFRATLATAQCSYLANLGQIESTLRGTDRETTVNRYFAIFCSILQSSQIWGNLMAYLFLQRHSDDKVIHNDDLCGANYSHNNHDALETVANPVSTDLIIGLYVTFVILILISLVLIILLADQKKNLAKVIDANGFLRSSLEFTTMTWKQMKKPTQILLFPLPFWLGTTEAFLFGIFTKSFITCSIGIEYVGLIMISFGIAAFISCLIIGSLGKFEHRLHWFLSSFLIYYLLLITMLIWKPNLYEIHIFYILVGVAGITGAIWGSFIPALHGYLFPFDIEAAFSNMILSQNIGNLVVFFCGGILSARATIVLQIIYLTIAICCYLVVEIEDRGSKFERPITNLQ